MSVNDATNRLYKCNCVFMWLQHLNDPTSPRNKCLIRSKGITHMCFTRVLHYISCYKLKIQPQALCLSMSCTEGVNHYNPLQSKVIMSLINVCTTFGFLLWSWIPPLVAILLVFSLQIQDWYAYCLKLFWYQFIDQLVSYKQRDVEFWRQRGQLCLKQNISTEKPN
jgi:hypothetical protein